MLHPMTKPRPNLYAAPLGTLSTRPLTAAEQRERARRALWTRPLPAIAPTVQGVRS